MRTVTITECSKVLTARERLLVKDLTDATKIDTLVQENEETIITPDFYATIAVTFDSADEGEDHEKYIIVDKDGEKYQTGSKSFWNSFTDIKNEMGDEPFSIKVYRRDSKNRQGKYFITCSIV